MPTQIQFKRGLSSNLNAATLTTGEPAFATDTGKFYIGDGVGKLLINPIDKPAGLDTGAYYTKVKVNEFGQVISLEVLTDEDIPALTASKITDLGTAALVDTGTSGGNIPVLGEDGKLSGSLLPNIAVNNTYVVGSEAEMLALDANVGDIAVRTDINQSLILQKKPATTIANWIKLLTPTDAVLSVNAKTGAVVLVPSDLMMTDYTLPSNYTPIVSADNLSQAVGKLERNFSNYAPLISPLLTGTPTAPTPTAGNNSTNIATTAFVQNALSVIDGGTF